MISARNLNEQASCRLTCRHVRSTVLRTRNSAGAAQCTSLGSPSLPATASHRCWSERRRALLASR